MNSQNGWPLIESNQLENLSIPGTKVKAVPGLLKGDVAWLLRWVGSEFNKRVDPLITPGCWGWNPLSPIPGSKIYSNHSSGTAIDLNAPHFPWMVKVMTTKQRQECRKIVNQTEGIVAWGGDFTTVVDEMHFEINGSSQDVARIVKKLKGVDMPTLTTLNQARIIAHGVGGFNGYDRKPNALTGAIDPLLKKNQVGQPLDKVVQHFYDEATTGIDWRNKRLPAVYKTAEGKLSKVAVIDYLSKTLKENI